MSNKWTHISERMPDEGQQIWIIVNCDNWGNDVENYFRIAHLIRGISEEDRVKMRAGKMPDSEEMHYWGAKGEERSKLTKRSDSYQMGDVGGNNTVPYQWELQQHHHIFGQEVTWWRPLCPKPKTGFRHPDPKFFKDMMHEAALEDKRHNDRFNEMYKKEHGCTMQEAFENKLGELIFKNMPESLKSKLKGAKSG